MWSSRRVSPETDSKNIVVDLKLRLSFEQVLVKTIQYTNNRYATKQLITKTLQN
jgi:hypothetical protein